MPVSRTETNIFSYLLVVSTVMVESAWLNLMAINQVVEYLLNLAFVGIDERMPFMGKSRSMVICFEVQVPSKVAAVFFMTVLMSNSVLFSRFCFGSMELRTRRLLVRPVSRSVSRSTIFKYFSCSSGGMVPSRIASI